MKKISILTVVAAATLLAGGCRPNLDEPQVADSTPADGLDTPAAAREAEMREAAAAARDAIPGTSPNGVPGLIYDSNAVSEATLEVQKQNVVTTVEQEMVAVDARIEALVSASEQRGQENREEVDAGLRTLRDQRQQLNALLNRMRSTNGAQWQDVQQEFRTVYQRFLNTLEHTEEMLGG